MDHDIVRLGDHTFPTLVAITPAEHMTGLMHKPWPPPIMCFPYLYAEPRKFWMKNTISPLDIIFCRNNKIISICYGEPMSTMQVGPDSPSDLVVELPHGTARHCGLTVGDPVTIQYSRRTIARDIRNVIRRISN